MHVILMRNELNTITVVLKPEWILLNQTGLPLFVMEPTLDIVEVEKQSIECPPSSSQILCQDEVRVMLLCEGTHILMASKYSVAF